MNMNGTYILLPVILTVFLASCVGGPTGTKDCGTDLVCFYASAAVCQPAKVSATEGALGLSAEILNATPCQVSIQITSAPSELNGLIGETMICPASAQLLNFSKEVLDTCSGTLASDLKNYFYPSNQTAFTAQYVSPTPADGATLYIGSHLLINLSVSKVPSQCFLITSVGGVTQNLSGYINGNQCVGPSPTGQTINEYTPPGLWTYYAQIIDSSGNVVNSATRTFTVVNP